uniref:15-cis-phytoene synthase n=1 Tax=Panagrellus redivivus TaxID=6233 RepID=A0A7E4VYG9_PANRE
MSLSAIASAPKRPPDAKAVKEALAYCSEVVAKRDYENYLVLKLLPAEVQSRVLAILAFNIEVSTIRQKIKRNSGVTGIYQLQFWKDVLETLFGDAKGPVPRQPAVTALHAYGSADDLPLFQKLVAARQETLGDRAFDTVSSLEQNSRDVHGSLMKLVANANGLQPSGPSREAFDVAADSMGAAVGVLTLIRATVPLLQEGVVLLPTDLMSIHGLSGDRIYNNKDPNALKALTKDLLHVGQRHLTASRKLTSDIPKPARIALLSSGARCDHILDLLNKNKCNLFEERLQHPYPFISWRLWWRKSRGIY